MRKATVSALILAAFAAGIAWGGDEKDGKEDDEAKESLQERLEKVRREVKVIELDSAMQRVPGIVQREQEYLKLVELMQADATRGKDITPLIEKGRAMKLAALGEINEILRKHKGKFAGVNEAEGRLARQLGEARVVDHLCQLE